MEKVGMNSVEVLMTCGLIFGVIRYWRWKLQGGYDIQLSNKTYGVFLGGQLLTILIMMLVSIDPQNSSYMESLSMFGSGALDYWTVIGVQLFGIVLLYMLSNVVGHLMYNVTLKEEMGIYDEIREENMTVSIVVSLLVLITGYMTSYYLLRSYIFDWISANSGLVPLI